jgi:hypothetical protein
MFKIEGLDKLQRELQRAQDALAELDGDLGSVSFNPEDPASIDQAIAAMERTIDERVAGYEDSSIIGSLAEEMKEQYRAMNERPARPIQANKQCCSRPSVV